ncbi:MAG: hypothetical protein GKR99_07855 [Rhodobacteraceae bacterium]|nr:hypothetical protein [Paracoccaceae bacterium]
MSDAAKRDEDEDVLTSIRRLVSAASPAQPKPVTPARDRLILSETDRVDSGTGSDPWTNTLENRIAELEAAVTAQKGEFEPDGSEFLDRETPRTIDHLATAKRMAAQFRDDDTAADTRDSAAPVDDEPIAPTPIAPAAITPATNTPASNTDNAPSVTTGEAQAEPATPQTAASVSPGPDSAPEVDKPVTADPAPIDPVAQMDEDALRLLISGILREEFQGDLGERVTRSIRKLVRQEIKRALATQDLD